MREEFLIYGFDFDGTLCIHDYPRIGVPDEEMINIAKTLKNDGHKIIMITNREGKELQEAVLWCSSMGLTFDAVNDNLDEIKKAWGVNTRKIFVNKFVDDRAVHSEAFKLEHGRKGTLTQRIANLKDLVLIQGQDGNWDFDPYMLGMYNGMELALSVMEGRNPVYRNAPEHMKEKLA